MADMDENLIKAITEQVIKAMQQGRELPAAINPPAGTCDGTFKPESSSSQTVAESLRDADALKRSAIIRRRRG